MAEENQTSKTNQTGKFPRPVGQFTISDLETLKVMTDPLRLKIIDLLMEQPRNVKFLASALNISSTKLYYHINMMEEKGILKVVSTRVVSGIIEKMYQPVAESFLVDRNLLQNEGEDGRESFLNSFAALLDATKDKIFDSIRNGVISTNGDSDEKKASLSFFSSGSRISRKRAAEFHERLEKLVLEFNDCDEEAGEPGEELKNYTITIAFFPTVETTSSNSEPEE